MKLVSTGNESLCNMVRHIKKKKLPKKKRRKPNQFLLKKFRFLRSFLIQCSFLHQLKIESKVCSSQPEHVYIKCISMLYYKNSYSMQIILQEKWGLCIMFRNNFKISCEIQPQVKRV